MFEELIRVVKELRERCPWDKKQTSSSTRPLLLNEAYELDEALASGDRLHIQEELGDYLFVGLFLADVLEKEHGIRLEEALAGIVAKLKERHPHVYGGVAVRDADEVLENWERIKRRSTAQQVESTLLRSGDPIREGRVGSVLDGLPLSLPALKQAQLIQERCRRVGFDWTDKKDVLDKVEEELGEVREELGISPERATEEIGDLLFAVVNLARHAGVDAESALRDGNAKFRRRFQMVEQEVGRQGRSVKGMTLEELDKVWNCVKGSEET